MKKKKKKEKETEIAKFGRICENPQEKERILFWHPPTDYTENAVVWLLAVAAALIRPCPIFCFLDKPIFSKLPSFGL